MVSIPAKYKTIAMVWNVEPGIPLAAFLRLCKSFDTVHSTGSAVSRIDVSLVPELRKLTKDNFDLESIINAAEELKYVGAIKRAIVEEFRNPSPDWIKYLTAKVYEGSFTQRVREQFTPLVAKAAKQFLSDQVNDRLKTALGASSYTTAGNEE